MSSSLRIKPNLALREFSFEDQISSLFSAASAPNKGMMLCKSLIFSREWLVLHRNFCSVCELWRNAALELIISQSFNHEFKPCYIGLDSIERICFLSYSKSFRAPQMDPWSTYWRNGANGSDVEMERRERKGWKVKIHYLSGSAIVAAFITSPFVRSTGCDWVARLNPGAGSIVRPDPCRPKCWEPWGKLEAWRDQRPSRVQILLPPGRSGLLSL